MTTGDPFGPDPTANLPGRPVVVVGGGGGGGSGSTWTLRTPVRPFVVAVIVYVPVELNVTLKLAVPLVIVGVCGVIVAARLEVTVTGPFTEVSSFETQSYQVERNPYYWQLPERPQVKAIRFLAFPGNDQAAFALISDEVDWAGSFVPAIDRIFAAEDREHHHYWFPPIDGGVYVQTTGPRFETPAEVRFLATVGDVVGMTIGTENVAMHERGLTHAAVCIVDNLGNGLGATTLTLEEFEAGKRANQAMVLTTLPKVLGELAR